MMFNKVAFVSDLNESVCANRARRAATLAGLEIEFGNYTLPMIDRICSKEFGAVIVDTENESKMGNLLFRSLRGFHRCLVPVLMFSEKIILLDNMATKKIEPDVSDEKLANYLFRSMEFYEATAEFEKEFNQRMDEIKHLTGDELNEAIEKLRTEIWEEKFSELLKKNEATEGEPEATIYKLRRPPYENGNHANSISP